MLKREAVFTLEIESAPIKGDIDGALDVLEKGALHKYLRRVPTGNPKHPYRYFYNAAHAIQAGVAPQVGEKVKVADRGQAGHYEVTAVHPEDNHVTLRHDETGHEMRVHAGKLRETFESEHAPAIQATRQEAKRVYEQAQKTGTDKQKARAKLAAEKIGVSVAEKVSPYEAARDAAEQASTAAHTAETSGAENAVDLHSAADRAHRVAMNEASKAGMQEETGVHNSASGKHANKSYELERKGAPRIPGLSDDWIGKKVDGEIRSHAKQLAGGKSTLGDGISRQEQVSLLAMHLARSAPTRYAQDNPAKKRAGELLAARLLDHHSSVASGGEPRGAAKRKPSGVNPLKIAHGPSQKEQGASIEQAAEAKIASSPKPSPRAEGEGAVSWLQRLTQHYGGDKDAAAERMRQEGRETAQKPEAAFDRLHQLQHEERLARDPSDPAVSMGDQHAAAARLSSERASVEGTPKAHARAAASHWTAATHFAEKGDLSRKAHHQQEATKHETERNTLGFYEQARRDTAYKERIRTEAAHAKAMKAHAKAQKQLESKAKHAELATKDAARDEKKFGGKFAHVLDDHIVTPKNAPGPLTEDEQDRFKTLSGWLSAHAKNDEDAHKLMRAHDRATELGLHPWKDLDKIAFHTLHGGEKKPDAHAEAMKANEKAQEAATSPRDIYSQRQKEAFAASDNANDLSRHPDKPIGLSKLHAHAAAAHRTAAEAARAYGDSSQAVAHEDREAEHEEKAGVPYADIKARRAKERSEREAHGLAQATRDSLKVEVAYHATKKKADAAVKATQAARRQHAQETIAAHNAAPPVDPAVVKKQMERKPGSVMPSSFSMTKLAKKVGNSVRGKDKDGHTWISNGHFAVRHDALNEKQRAEADASHGLGKVAGINHVKGDLEGNGGPDIEHIIPRRGTKKWTFTGVTRKDSGAKTKQHVAFFKDEKGHIAGFQLGLHPPHELHGTDNLSPFADDPHDPKYVVMPMRIDEKSAKKYIDEHESGSDVKKSEVSFAPALDRPAARQALAGMHSNNFAVLIDSQAERPRFAGRRSDPSVELEKSDESCLVMQKPRQMGSRGTRTLQAVRDALREGYRAELQRQVMGNDLAAHLEKSMHPRAKGLLDPSYQRAIREEPISKAAVIEHATEQLTELAKSDVDVREGLVRMGLSRRSLGAAYDALGLTPLQVTAGF